MQVKSLKTDPIIPFFAIVIFSTVSFPLVFGHGLGGEIHPPVFLEGRDVTLSINISPSIYDPNESEHYITLNLKESKSEAIVEHATFEFELSKDGKQLFKDLFHDDLGNLVIKVLYSDDLLIKGDKAPGTGAWMRSSTEPVVLSGPVFYSGGLYEYKIRIITMDDDDNMLDLKGAVYSGAVSLAEHNTFEVIDSKKSLHTLNIISYFDTVKSFEYNSEKILFSMPFDWNQNLEQLTVVHEEIQIPPSFSEFLYTKYEAKINGVLLDEDSVTIDDYSSKGRTIHILASKETLQQIREQAMEKSNSVMYFELGPSKEIATPLEGNTPDLRYKIFLSWSPQTIQPGKETTFFLNIQEMFTDKSQKEIEYDVSLSQQEKIIYNKHIYGFVNSADPDQFDFTFTPEDEGTITLDIFDIQGNSLSRANFLVVVEPEESRNFPIRLQSVSNLGSDGNYNVDLTWFPNTLGLGESEFVITFYDKNSGLPVRGTTYDFVLIRDGKEIHHNSGLASAGGTFENFVFVEGETGDLTLRIEKINGTDEYAEIKINVAPEFSFTAPILLGILICFAVFFSKTKLVKLTI